MATNYARPRSASASAGTIVTTPRAASTMALLGSGATSGSVTWTRGEWDAIRKLYGFVPEPPNRRPPPPQAPQRGDFTDAWKFEDAMAAHARALKAHEKWQDPQPLMQAGADRNAVRYAEVDGLRMIAWLARYVEPGKDPLQTLVQLAVEAGLDVDPEDVEWAEEDG